MGRNVSENATIAAMQAAESEEHAKLSAEEALVHELKAKQYADAAANSAGQGTGGGIMTADVYIYQRSHVNFPPTLPVIDTVFTFGTGELTFLTNGWSRTFPTSNDGDYLFVTYAVATAPNGSLIATITPDKWTEAQLMASSGTGDSTTAYWMTHSAGVIQKDTQDQYTPGAVNFRALAITGSEPVRDYGARFKISVTYDGVSYAQTYGSANDESQISYTVPKDIKAMRVGMYLAGGLTTLLHEELIPIVNDGISFVVKIESTNGDTFKVGEASSTTLIAHVFRNGTEVTDTISPANFRWRRVSFTNPQYPNDDATWNSDYQTGYRSVLISTDVVNSRATFFCDIVK